MNPELAERPSPPDMGMTDGEEAAIERLIPKVKQDMAEEILAGDGRCKVVLSDVLDQQLDSGVLAGFLVRLNRTRSEPSDVITDLEMYQQEMVLSYLDRQAVQQIIRNRAEEEYQDSLAEA